MANFVTDKHIVYIFGGQLPHRKCENSGLNIELSSVNRTVLHYQILCGKEFGKLGLDLVVDHVVF